MPLPQIQDVLDRLGRSKYFSVLDLAQGFHQISLDKESRVKTAFSSDIGHWQYTKLPMGLKNSPPTFQRLMNNVLCNLIGLKCLVYLDDIIVFSTDLSEHDKRIREVFSRLRTHNLKLQPIKCEFLRKEVIYLGHKLTEKGVQPDERKIKSVKTFPIPTTVKEIKSFLGLTGYYRNFVPDYGKIAKPITNLLRKGIEFIWTSECQEAFEKLKIILCNEPLLQYPDFEKPFIITCDASNYAVGCVLSQGVIPADLPIAYASRTLNKAEINYSTTEKELVAIMFGVKQFRPYVYGQKFTIITDHKPLTWLFSVKDPGSRLLRWRIKLDEFDYEIQYKSGKTNLNADALSRIKEINLIETTTKELTSITMCPETQPLRIGSAGLPCEVELFMKPTVVPATYDVAVTCDQSDNAKNIQLRGVGILTLSEQCRAHTPQVVLTPSRHLKSVQYLDFIPPVNIPSVKIPLVPSFKFDNLLNHQTSIIKLNHISDFSKTIEELENAVQDEKNRSILQTTSGLEWNEKFNLV
ncbi:hypothetical protein QTP88_011244 [Uroleucon formosanum]